MAKLVLTGGPDAREIDLAGVVTIGRHASNTVAISDGTASKHHAELRLRDDGRWWIRDRESHNGTRLRGERVREAALSDGDEITIGSRLFRFVDPAAAVGSPSVELNSGDAWQVQSSVDLSGSAAPPPDLQQVTVLRREYEKLKMAWELGRAIAWQTEEAPLVARLLHLTMEMLPAASSGAILLLDPSGKPVPKCSLSREPGRTSLGISSTIVQRVCKRLEAVLTLDASLDDRFREAPSIIAEGIRASMCVPMIAGGELLGVVVLSSRVASSGSFDQHTLELLVAIASQAALLLANARNTRKLEEQTRQRAQLRRLLSPALVDRVLAGEIQVKPGGELRDATILFADVRGFTSFCEATPPQEVVAFLNDYFGRMVEVLFAHRGTLDKYIGDGLMAIFGAPVASATACADAVDCAIEMRDAVEELNAALARAGKPRVAIGIGVARGEVVTGMVGSKDSLQYTAIGDPVNTASRLCDLAKPAQILIADEVLRDVEDRVTTEPVGMVKVKGKRNELSVSAVLGRRGEEEVTAGEIDTRKSK